MPADLSGATNSPAAAPGLSAAINRLWLPRTALASCLRGVMSRNTLGLALPAERRFNHFPATPLCSISWWFEGSSEMLPRGAAATLDTPRSSLPSRIVFGGPHTGPSCSWNPGGVHAMMLLLMPDAVHRLTGLDIAAWVDRLAPAGEVLPADWMAMCEAVLTCPLADAGGNAGVDAATRQDEQRVALMQDFLDPRWQAVRPAGPMQAHRYQDWARSLALHAATSGAGRSLRQVERRIKQWAGLPMRELRGMGRAEQAFFETLASADPGQSPRWTDLAQATGYADQSHLCRETRRITGFSPDELYRRIAEDECFWSYRLWQ